MKAMKAAWGEALVRQALAVMGGRKAKELGLTKDSAEYKELIRGFVDSQMAEGFDDEDVVQAQKVLAELKPSK